MTIDQSAFEKAFKEAKLEHLIVSGESRYLALKIFAFYEQAKNMGEPPEGLNDKLAGAESHGDEGTAMPSPANTALVKKLVEALQKHEDAHGEWFRIISLLQCRLKKTTNHLRRNMQSKRLVNAGDAILTESVERLERLLKTLPPRNETLTEANAYLERINHDK